VEIVGRQGHVALAIRRGDLLVARLFVAWRSPPPGKARKNRHHPNNPYSFTNCLTDTIHKIVSMRSVRRYVTTTSELSGNEKASQNFGF